MNFDSFNKWSHMVANIAVLAGIGFLAIEIQQNTESVQSQTRSDIASNHLWLYDYLANNDIFEYYFMFGRGEIDDATIENTEFQSFHRAMFTVWENEWYHYTQGMFIEDAFIPQLKRWENNLGREATRKYWETSRQLYSSSFARKVDELIRTIENRQTLTAAET